MSNFTRATLTPELRQRMTVLNLYLTVGVVYCLVFGPLYLYIFPIPWLGWLHVSLIPVLLWTIWHNWTRQAIDLGENILRALTVVMIVTLSISGGAWGSGLMFALAGVVFMFFLGKRQLGLLVSSGSLVLVVGWWFVAMLAGNSLSYSAPHFIAFIICYILIILFQYIYSGQKDKLDRVVARQVEELKQLLAESKKLQQELAREKAGVERQVQERTQELSAAKAELAASVSGLPFGFALINLKGEIVFSNGALSRLLHRPIPPDLGKSRQVLQEVAREYHKVIDLLDCIHQVQTKRPSIVRNVEFGPRFFRFIFRSVRTEGAVIGALLIMEDTTEERALERSRDEFFSIASHELRTPLTAVRGNTDMMLQYYQEALKDPALHEMVEDIHDGSVRLISIVNDFLDVSRLEQAKVAFKNTAFDVVELGRTVLRMYDVTGSRHKLALTIEEPKAPLPKVFADSDRVNQILVNLVSNAIKFTEKGGVTLRFTVVGHQVKISVTDTGTGIPVESQHLLFRKFQQASNNILTRDNTRSTGLGLYISHLLAQQMAGKLYLETTEVGHGSTFTLELPVATTGQVEDASKTS
jgi:two-component system, OmpR family, phosphate regulon sensor histidine kinase PhoR